MKLLINKILSQFSIDNFPLCKVFLFVRPLHKHGDHLLPKTN